MAEQDTSEDVVRQELPSDRIGFRCDGTWGMGHRDKCAGSTLQPVRRPARLTLDRPHGPAARRDNRGRWIAVSMTPGDS